MQTLHFTRYLLPVLISASFVILSELNYFYLILPLLLVANLLNAYWGEFTTAEILAELRQFYGSPSSKVLKRISAILLAGMVIWSVFYYSRQDFSFGWAALFTLCTGALTGCFLVTLAHDLMHSQKRIDQLLSGLLLLMAGIPYMAADHVVGHHRMVGLAEDTNTAKLNQNFYFYFGRLFSDRIKNSYFHGYNLPLYIKRKIHRLNLLMLMLQVFVWAVVFIFFSGTVLFFFIMQGLIAYFLYELINYIQHYGLSRSHSEHPITMQSSWNCYYKYTNYILYMLPLHSLHHLSGAGRKIAEANLKSGPRLPYLYFVMVFMALIPSLWFKKMNTLALQFNQQNAS